jgi:YVTN family beta-propeller protein
MRIILRAALVSLFAISACGSSGGTAAPTPDTPDSSAPTKDSSGSGDPAWVTGRATVGSQPCGILGAAGKIWVSDFGNDDLVTVDPLTLHVGPRIKVGAKPCGLAYGGRSIWVEDYGSAEVTRVDARTGRVQHTYDVGLSPYDVTFAAGAAWVTNYSDGTVSRVDAATGHVATVRTGGTPIGIAPSGGLIWVGLGAAGIAAIDETTGELVHHLHTRGPAGWTAYHGEHLWVDVGESVVLLDGASGRVVDRFPVGSRPEDGSVVDGVAWIPDADGSLRRLGGALVSRRPVSSGVGNPFVLAGYRGRVWVVDFAGTDVVRINPSRVG